MGPNPNKATLMGNLAALLPKILLTSKDYLDKLDRFCVDNDIFIWLYDEKDSIADLVPSQEETDEDTNDQFPASNDPSDLALVLWSSGSTGSPKGRLQKKKPAKFGKKSEPPRSPPPLIIWDNLVGENLNPFFKIYITLNLFKKIKSS